MVEELENGCLGEGTTNNDYLLSEGLVDGLPTLYEQDSKRFYYNQSKNDWSKKSCTIFASIGAISDLFNYQFTESEIKEIDTLSYSKGRVANSGWYVQAAVKLVADWWNEHHSDLGKVAYYRIEIDNDELMTKVLSKNYDIVSGFYGNVKWQNDYYADAILNGTEFGTATYGHSICFIGSDSKRYIKDNYKGRKGKNKIDTNTYELEHKFSEIDGLHNTGYVYTKVAEDSIEEIKRLNEITTLCNNLITDLGSLYHKVSDTNFQGILHYTAEKLRSKISDCNTELNKYK